MFNSVTKSKFLALLAVIALFSAVIFAGGCDGGSSSSSPDNKGLELAYDQDGDGVPDVFDDYPADGTKNVYQKAAELNTLADADAEKLAVTLPCRGEGTFKAAECKAGEAVKYFLFRAEEGKPVCALFMSQYLLGQALPFSADITVQPYAANPAASKEEGSEGTDDDPVQKADPSEIIPLEDTSLECEVNEFGTDAIAAVRFTPKKSGIYVLKVRKADAYGEEKQEDEADEKFGFIMFTDTDGNWLDDIWKSELTPDDFAAVIGLLRPFMTGELKEDGTPDIKEKILKWAYDDGRKEYIKPEKVVTAYLEGKADSGELPIPADDSAPVMLLGAANSNSAPLNASNADAAAKGTMSSELYDIPFIYGFGMSNLGKGMNAVFGPRTTTGEKVVASMTKPDNSKYKGGFKSSTTMEFVNSDDKLEKEVSNTSSAGLKTTVGKTALKGSDKHTWANTAKFSENTTTLKIKYTRLSNEYLDGTNVRLTADAKAALDKDKSAGKAAFRKVYGDYYLAGYQLGAQCVVTLAITANSKSEINTIENALGLNIADIQLDNTFKNKVAKALASTKIKYTCTVLGGNDIALPKPVSGEGNAGTVVGNIVDNVNAYMKGVNAGNMAVVNCHFKHISTLAGSFPNTMPASKDYFTKENKLYNLLWAVQTRSNVIDGLDSDIFNNNEKQKYVRKYTELQDKINNITSESEMVKNIDSNLKAAQTSLDEMQAVIDRFYFWCKLINQRKNWWYADGFGEYGYKGYVDSKFVNADLAVFKSYSGSDKRKGSPFWRCVMYSPEASNSSEKITYTDQDHRVVYARLMNDGYKYDALWDYAWDKHNLLSFGGNVMFHYWKGGMWAGVDYSYEYRTAYMPYGKYPFVAGSLDGAFPQGKKEERVKK